MGVFEGDQFTVRGLFEGESVEVSYRQGALDGHGPATDKIRQVLEDGSVLHLTPQDDGHPASVDDPYAVMAAIQQVIDIDVVEGDYPIPEADDSAT